MRILDRDSWTGTIRLHKLDEINKTGNSRLNGHSWTCKWADMSPQIMNHILCLSNIKVLSPLMTIWV